MIEMARHACVIEDWPLPDPDDNDVRELLPAGDSIVILAVDSAGIDIGAVWAFQHEPPLVRDADAQAMPEIAIAVSPSHRGAGVGSALLDELLRRASGRYAALSLNVHQRNPARHLYERKRFRSVGQGRGPLGIAMVSQFL
ncbi:hypothetical protein A5784_36010 [Mycobacterium sp. 852013-50091_SCH5140682]|nr:hypothetical protein A5784_36010 [Mycobacterium sp. 852013-50091_SCH5140682]